MLRAALARIARRLPTLGSALDDLDLAHRDAEALGLELQALAHTATEGSLDELAEEVLGDGDGGNRGSS